MLDPIVGPEPIHSPAPGLHSLWRTTIVIWVSCSTLHTMIYYVCATGVNASYAQ